MASLEKRPHGYRVVFMFGGEKFARSLQTKDSKQAKATVARLEDTLRRIELGTLPVPDGTDIATFLLSDGKLTEKQRNEKPLTLTQIFDAYFANLPAGANEQTTIDGMRLHQRHLERLIGSDFAVQRLTTADLQTFIEKRSKEKGFRGNVTATTIRKALVTFRTIWRWGMMTGKLTGTFPNRGLKYPKSSEKPPFQTWAEIERQIQRGGLTDAEIGELWDCLYLTLPEIDELLAYVKEHAAQPFIHPMFAFAAHTGARRSEMVRSRINDLDFEGNIVTVHERKKTHSKTTTRRVPMTPLLAEVLRACGGDDSSEVRGWFSRIDVQCRLVHHPHAKTMNTPKTSADVMREMNDLAKAQGRHSDQCLWEVPQTQGSLRDIPSTPESQKRMEWLNQQIAELKQQNEDKAKSAIDDVTGEVSQNAESLMAKQGLANSA